MCFLFWWIVGNFWGNSNEICGTTFTKCKSLQIMGPFFRHSVFMVISVFRSSHTKPKSFKIAPISAVLSQIHVIALEIPTFGGKTVPQKPRICKDLHLLTKPHSASHFRWSRDRLSGKLTEAKWPNRKRIPLRNTHLDEYYVCGHQ